MDSAAYAAHGLYDPAAPNAADRLELLEWLAGLGITVEQMVDANTRGALTRPPLRDRSSRPSPRVVCVRNDVSVRRRAAC
jgi:hypothetical protein